MHLACLLLNLSVIFSIISVGVWAVSAPFIMWFYYQRARLHKSIIKFTNDRLFRSLIIHCQVVTFTKAFRHHICC